MLIAKAVDAAIAEAVGERRAFAVVYQNIDGTVRNVSNVADVRDLGELLKNAFDCLKSSDHFEFGDLNA